MVEVIDNNPIADSIVVLMVGIPASGKSTLARNLSQQISQMANATTSQYAAAIVSLDQIQMELTTNGSGEEEVKVQAWHDSKRVALEKVRGILSQARDDATPTLVIVDDTFEYASMRKVYYQLARELHTRYLELHVVCPIDQAIANNQARQEQSAQSSDSSNQLQLEVVTEQTIRNVHSRMQKCQYASEDGHQIELQWLELLNMSANDSSVLLERIFSVAKEPKEIESATQSNSEQLLSQGQKDELDQHLRKHISELLKTQPQLRKFAQKMSQLKKEVLQQQELSGADEIEQLKEQIKVMFDEKLNELVIGQTQAQLQNN